jgi:hypothetical protein
VTDDRKDKERAQAERRQADRRRNASLDFGIADRRRSERRDGEAERG